MSNCNCKPNYLSVGEFKDGKYRIHFQYFGTNLVAYMDRENTLAFVERAKSMSMAIHFQEGATMIGLLEEIGNGSDDTEV